MRRESQGSNLARSRQPRVLTVFKSNEDVFQAVAELIARLERAGHPEAAAELRRGLACLNGLTDGWVLFLESIERSQTAVHGRVAHDEEQALNAIKAAVNSVIHRR